MSLTIEEVEKIAHLARIDLTDEQKDVFYQEKAQDAVQ